LFARGGLHAVVVEKDALCGFGAEVRGRAAAVGLHEEVEWAGLGELALTAGRALELQRCEFGGHFFCPLIQITNLIFNDFQ